MEKYLTPSLIFYTQVTVWFIAYILRLKKFLRCPGVITDAVEEYTSSYSSLKITFLKFKPRKLLAYHILLLIPFGNLSLKRQVKKIASRMEKQSSRPGDFHRDIYKQKMNTKELSRLFSLGDQKIITVSNVPFYHFKQF